jgi:hypothetical protein
MNACITTTFHYTAAITFYKKKNGVTEKESATLSYIVFPPIVLEKLLP